LLFLNKDYSIAEKDVNAEMLNDVLFAGGLNEKMASSTIRTAGIEIEALVILMKRSRRVYGNCVV